ncbi:hypothetical protein Rhe02_29600 [Rhizocola hellebori]|uniref:Uncharacterized protein n=1 Tax=Rhizocola hellebori TaxID=1392758 RepID=A0A8J3Q6E2_9ACTN|nr:hypothetical protein [Rhizocola hellebori]GIH04893.1 hypothetical protein Rhe02_29600 [Rhizocola hellebori]
MTQDPMQGLDAQGIRDAAANVVERDIDGDGQPDSFLVDVDGDGEIDMALYDDDGDGVTDRVIRSAE